MKFSIQVDEKCEQALHKSTCGDAFALEPKSKLVIFGGEYNTTLVDLNDPSDIVKQIPIKTSIKWFVNNYDWEPFNSSQRFLQTRYKIIEIINTETSETLLTLNSHSQPINEAKWSPKKPNLFASTSNDCNILLWSTDSNKPINTINSVGEVDCLAWSKNKENLFACSCNNDIRIYDIRKTNSALRYLTNAHTKKIYSLDWCSGPEEILLSSSRDRNIKLWNFNMLNQKFMEKILEDFPCWKAKFTPFGLCFAVIPTSQSIYNPYQFKNNQINNPKSFTRDLNESILNNNNNNNHNNNDKGNDELDSTTNENDKNRISTSVNNNNNNSSFKQCTINNNNLSTKNEPLTSLLICQITSFDEAKVFKFVTNKFDTILNFDFYIQNDRFNIVSWTNDQYLCIQSIDSSQLIVKDLERSSSAHNNLKIKEEDDSSSNINVSIKGGLFTNNNQIQPNTSNSSRKSSISEFGYGTPPTNLTTRSILDRESFNLTDENNDLFKINSNSLSMNSHNLLRSSSALLVGHEFLKQHPKCFGAKFSGLPEQFIIFTNEGKYKINQREPIDAYSSKRTYRNTSKMKASNSTISKSHFQHNKQLAKRVQAKVYIHNISILININKEFAENYLIIEPNLKKHCDQNIMTAVYLKRFDIAKIWELLKFITFNNMENFSLNPDHGRPWSCSTFGRPLINTIIDNCVKSNDIQTAAMIVSKLKQHDMNMVPIASTLNRNALKKCESFTYNSSLTYSFSNSSSIAIKEDLAFHAISKLSKAIEENNESDFIKHHQNLGLLAPSRMNEFDFLIKFYCEILYRWSLFNKRIEMLEFVYEKPTEMDEKFECSKRCVKCSSPTKNSKCNKCNLYLTYCSICELPVNGLTIYCAICGHGGHYDHLIEWFKRHDDCPSACGCRCIDYL